VGQHERDYGSADSPPRPPARSVEPKVYLYGRYRRAVAQNEGMPALPPVVPAGAALVCAVLVVLGSLGPWLRGRDVGAAPETLPGYRTDGVLALVAGIVAVGALLWMLVRRESGAAAWVAAGALGLGALVGGASWVVLDTGAAGYEALNTGASVEVAVGLATVTLPAVVGFGCAVLVVRRLE
jgi:hypothetical protein